jgi:hypothetical protein
MKVSQSGTHEGRSPEAVITGVATAILADAINDLTMAVREVYRQIGTSDAAMRLDTTDRLTAAVTDAATNMGAIAYLADAVKAAGAEIGLGLSELATAIRDHK